MKEFLKNAFAYFIVIGVIFAALKYLAGWNVTFWGCFIVITVLEIIGTAAPYVLGIGIGLHFFRWLFGIGKNS